MDSTETDPVTNKRNRRPKKQVELSLYLTDEELYDDQFYYYDDYEELPFNPRDLEDSDTFGPQLPPSNRRPLVNDNARFGETGPSFLSILPEKNSFKIGFGDVRTENCIPRRKKIKRPKKRHIT